MNAIGKHRLKKNVKWPICEEDFAFIFLRIWRKIIISRQFSGLLLFSIAFMYFSFSKKWFYTAAINHLSTSSELQICTRCDYLSNLTERAIIQIYLEKLFCKRFGSCLHFEKIMNKIVKNQL